MNKWQLLASLQALFIYILIRLSDGETAYNNYDHLLLATLAVSADLNTILIQVLT
jgi:hypothetical protein